MKRTDIPGAESIRAAANYAPLLRGVIADKALGTRPAPAPPAPWTKTTLTAGPRDACDEAPDCQCTPCQLRQAATIAGDGLALVAPTGSGDIVAALVAAVRDVQRTPQLQDTPPTPELVRNIAKTLMKELRWPPTSIEQAWQASRELLADGPDAHRTRPLLGALLDTGTAQTEPRNRSWDLAEKALWLIEHPDATLHAYDTVTGHWLKNVADNDHDTQIGDLLLQGWLRRIPSIDRNVLSVALTGNTRTTVTEHLDRLELPTAARHAARYLCDLERAGRQGNIHAMARALLVTVLTEVNDGRPVTSTPQQRWDAARKHAGRIPNGASRTGQGSGAPTGTTGEPFVEAFKRISGRRPAPRHHQLSREMRDRLHAIGWDAQRWDDWVSAQHERHGLRHGSDLERKAHEKLSRLGPVDVQKRYAGSAKTADLHVTFTTSAPKTRTPGTMSVFCEIDGPWHFTGYDYTKSRNSGTLERDGWKAQWVAGEQNTDVDVLVRVHHRRTMNDLAETVTKAAAYACRNGWLVVELGGPGPQGQPEWTTLPEKWMSTVVDGIRYARPARRTRPKTRQPSRTRAKGGNRASTGRDGSRTVK